jgi:hypothetical protein
LPTRPLPLVQVFPVMRRVPVIAALRDLLARVGERRPLVVVVDDAQWADDDSHTLLSEVLREPDAPRMLLVATVRWSGETPGGNTTGRAEALGRLMRALGPRIKPITLGPLPPDASLELASLLLQRAGDTGGADAASIAAGAAGHPLFIDILARRSAHLEGGGAPAPSVQDALHGLLSDLDSDARAIVEVVSLADAPLRARVVAAAVADGSHDGGTRFVPAVQRLRVARLVVSSGARADDLIEPYHDRVRSAVVADLAPERRAERHLAIARALEATEDADPQVLALHWSGAGDQGRAAHYASLAGDRAAQALAFDRAASFYQQALRPASLTAEERRKLKAKLGDALANGGNGKRAAAALAEAAEGAPAAEALDLRRRAADQLLRSGHFDEGLVAIDRVLRTVGVRLPATAFGALVYLLVLRAWLVVRTLSYRKRDVTQVSAEALVRVDTCWSAAFGLSLSETVRGTALQARNLLAALGQGEPTRIARAIALEVSYYGTGGSRSWRRTQALIDRATAEAEAIGTLYSRGWIAMTTGIAHYLAGRHVTALSSIDSGIQSLREHGRDVSWEIGSGEMFAVSMLGNLGRVRDLRDRVRRALPEMSRRGDLHGSIHLRIGWASLAWLVDDDVEEARKNIDEAMKSWSRRGYHLTHFWEMLARTNLALYAGRPSEAVRSVNERWVEMERSLLPMRVQALRVTARDLRARATLACAEQEEAGRDARLRTVLRDARRMRREGLVGADARARLLQAGVANLRGDKTKAVGLLRDALGAFASEDLALNAAITRTLLGSLVGGEEGRALRDDAATWFAAQTVKRPERFVAMFAPGFGTDRSRGA